MYSAVRARDCLHLCLPQTFTVDVLPLLVPNAVSQVPAVALVAVIFTTTPVPRRE